MQLLKYTKYWIAGLALFVLTACGKEHYQYEKYIENGPIVYPGRADTLLAKAGKERIQLSWAVPSDLNITGYKLFWNFGADSLPLPGRSGDHDDTLSVYVNNLPEGAYSFTLYSYDAQGHRSVGTQAFGYVYGPVFASTIFNRPIRNLRRAATGDSLIVAWVGLDAKSIGTEWSYTGLDGQAASLFSPLGDSTIITHIDVAQPIAYRSLFLPEAQAIDTFYTAFKPI